MTRLAAAVLCLLVGLYWLAVGSAGSRSGGGGLRVLVAIFIGGSLAAAAYALAARRFPAAMSVVPAMALGIATFAAAGPWLLNDWVRGDSDRYLWVIRHVSPCSDMGGGPGMLWVFGSSWVAAAGAFLYAATFPLTLSRVLAGLGLGAAALGVTAAAMFPDPEVFAWALGCL